MTNRKLRVLSLTENVCNVDFQFFYVSVCSISVSSQVKLVNHMKDVLEEFLSSHFFLAGS